MSNVLSSLLTTNFQQVGFKKASSQTHLVSLMSPLIVLKLGRIHEWHPGMKIKTFQAHHIRAESFWKFHSDF